MIALRCGWRVEWVRALDIDDYTVLVDLLTRDARADEAQDLE